MNINISNNTDTDLTITLLKKSQFENEKLAKKDILQKLGFKADQDEVCFLAESNMLFVGFDDDIASSAATALRFIKTKEYIKNISITTNENDDKNIYDIVQGVILGNYTFDKYKSIKTGAKIDNVYLDITNSSNDCKDVISKSTIIANATNFARDIVNTTPEDCYPETLANIANKLSLDNNLECNVLNKNDIANENMNALLAVARASRHEPKVIHLAHRPHDAKKKVLLIGKGLTYDSGGLSLKPADFMVSMKADKSGACTILGIIKSISELNSSIEVHGFIGAVENMIGGDAYKPDDVLVAKNGKTIEVRNTDAEGRLVLADVLCYAQQEVSEFDYIIDMATLTGACVVGVGNYTTGIMGHNDELKSHMKKSSNASGEFATPLDFNRFLARTLKNELADICNISNTRYGGALTAGLFLSEFIEEKNQNKWLHLDIAGPAYVEHIWGVNPYGGSGAGVRMVVEFIETI